MLKNYLKHFSILILTFALTSACTTTDVQSDTAKSTTPTIQPLVTAKWLNEHINDPDLVVLDCTVIVEMDENGFRNLSGRDSYEKAHIPSAGFADLTGELSDQNSPYPLTMPSPEQFAAVMGKLGVGDDSRVVLYSSTFPSWPARVWWMLRWIGFDNVAVLDGGLAAWQMEGLPLSTEAATRSANQLSINLRPELVADRDEVYTAIKNDSVTLVDALPEAHYRGEMQMYKRTGHIPGAINMPDFNNLGETGSYLSYDELDLMFDDNRDQRSITYCGGGISASSVAFTMHRLGFSDVAVYMGSLQEWVEDPENPLVTK